MTYEEFDEVFYDHLDTLLYAYSGDLGVSFAKLYKAMDNKDVFNSMKDALMSVVTIEEED